MSTTPNAVSLSRALGWFSIGLGLAELLGARDIARTMGMREARPLIRGFGLREIGTGLAILGSPAGPAGLWARVAGDALDLAALGRAASDRWNPRRDNALLGFLTVAGVTLVDITVAMMLHQRAARSVQQRGARGSIRCRVRGRPLPRLLERIRRCRRRPERGGPSRLFPLPSRRSGASLRSQIQRRA